jgi:hypothetical protein
MDDKNESGHRVLGIHTRKFMQFTFKNEIAILGEDGRELDPLFLVHTILGKQVLVMRCSLVRYQNVPFSRSFWWRKSTSCRLKLPPISAFGSNHRSNGSSLDEE